jgi:long-chain acyl-CoA synthetase
MRRIRIAFIEAVMRPLVALLAKPDVQSELTTDPSKPVLLVCNHVTTYDGALVLYALPWATRHRVAIAMAGEKLVDFRRARGQGNLFLNLMAPFAYYLVTGLFNVFPLPQKSGFRESFAHAGKAMDLGYHVLVFPEGRRSDDETVHTFQAGSGLLWKELGADVVPVYLKGLGELKRRGSGWFRSGELSIIVGKPIQVDATQDASVDAAALERAVRELRDSRSGADPL